MTILEIFPLQPLQEHTYSSFSQSLFLFLAPVALVSAEMTATYTAKGEEGVYGWVKKAFGPNVAMLAVWFQWINTLIWFPSILTFLAGTIAYLFNPNFAQNIKFTIIFITVVLVFDHS